MIGYPNFIMDPKELDKVFNDVSAPVCSQMPLEVCTWGTSRGRRGPGGRLEAPRGSGHLKMRRWEVWGWFSAPRPLGPPPRSRCPSSARPSAPDRATCPARHSVSRAAPVSEWEIMKVSRPRKGQTELTPLKYQGAPPTTSSLPALPKLPPLPRVLPHLPRKT